MGILALQLCETGHLSLSPPSPSLSPFLPFFLLSEKRKQIDCFTRTQQRSQAAPGIQQALSGHLLAAEVNGREGRRERVGQRQHQKQILKEQRKERSWGWQATAHSDREAIEESRGMNRVWRGQVLS